MSVKNKSKQTAKHWLQPFIQLNLPTTWQIILIFSQGNICILLDVLVCSIAVYFCESCSFLASPKGESKYKWCVKIYSDTAILKCLIRDLLSNVFVSPKFWLAKVFDFSRSQGNGEFGRGEFVLVSRVICTLRSSVG